MMTSCPKHQFGDGPYTVATAFLALARTGHPSPSHPLPFGLSYAFASPCCSTSKRYFLICSLCSSVSFGSLASLSFLLQAANSRASFKRSNPSTCCRLLSLTINPRENLKYATWFQHTQWRFQINELTITTMDAVLGNGFNLP
jgi:hypothetical protein